MIFLGNIALSHAAVIPSGTKLAIKQEIVRNNFSEPAPLTFDLSASPLLRSHYSLRRYYGWLRLTDTHFSGLVFGTCARNTHSIEKCQDLLGFALFFTNSPTPAAPVCVLEWIFASMTIQKLLPTSWTNYRHTRLNEFRRYHVHPLVSTRMFRCLRFVSFVTARNARLAT